MGLSKIYLHAENAAKTGPLLTLPGAAERLKLFAANLCEEGSFDSAVEGCKGVFHVASPTDFSKLSEVIIINLLCLLRSFDA